MHYIFNTAIALVCMFYFYSLLVDKSYQSIADPRIISVKISSMKYLKNSANPERELVNMILINYVAWQYGDLYNSCSLFASYKSLK